MGDETGEITNLGQYLGAKEAGSLNGNTYTFQSRVPLARDHLAPWHYSLSKDHDSEDERFLRAEITRDSGEDIVEVLLSGHLDDRAVLRDN